jgi:hypothetical protein
MDGASGPARWALEAHQQVHDLARVGAAVEQVAGLYELGFTAGPTVFSVDDADSAQQPHKLIVVAVYVSDSNNALRITGIAIGASRPLRDGGKHKETHQYAQQPSDPCRSRLHSQLPFHFRMTGAG